MIFTFGLAVSMVSIGISGSSSRLYLRCASSGIATNTTIHNKDKTTLLTISYNSSSMMAAASQSWV